MEGCIGALVHDVLASRTADARFVELGNACVVGDIATCWANHADSSARTRELKSNERVVRGDYGRV
jgi:hypothetical protein